MNLPSRPPEDSKPLPELVKLFPTFFQAEVRHYIHKANARYYYWDDIKYRPTPAQLNVEDAWIAIKNSRQSSFKNLPLIDELGNSFKYWLPENFQEILHEVDKGAAGAMLFDDQEHLTLFRESQDQILVSSLMDEAIATSQIEGAITTRDQAKRLLRDDKRPKNKSEQMVVNSYRTIQMLREIVHEPLSIGLLHRIQKEITHQTLDDETKAGTFRTDSDKIVIADESSAQTIFTPPPADLLPERVQKLVEFANEKNSENAFIHPLIKASILHFWLAYEHPYCDGNGRTARALFYWFMLKNGYGLFEYLTISRIVHQSPMQYYRSFLYTEYDDNDLTYSIVYMLRVTKNALKQLRTLLRDKQNESRKVSASLRKFPNLNHRQREIIKHAIKNPSHRYTITAHQKSHNTSYQTARTDLLNLSEQGLLDQSLAGKQMVFFPSGDLLKKLK